MGLNNLIEKLKGPEGMQYLLGGALVLVIVVALGAVIFGGNFGFGNNGPDRPTEAHFYDLEKKQEFTIPIEEYEQYVTPDMMMQPEWLQRVKSPINNNKPTAIPMVQCPACKEYFVPESWLKPMGPMAMEPGKRICTHCGTDIDQWYQEQYQKRKGK